MSTNHWIAYTPDKNNPWNLRRVVHLHRRLAFAATWPELQRDLKEGPERAIPRLLSGTANLHTARDYEATATLLSDAAVTQGEISRLKASWFYRFLFTPDPFLEKLTLLWHDHFATANTKVEDTGLMRRQNDSLRRYSKARFGDLLNTAVREPALLIYLDAPTNRKGHPNENLGRELLELFTLGIGNYSETDVKEAARALTGWSVDDGNFLEMPLRHDEGTKTILGQTGPLNGAQLLELLLKHHAVAERIAIKLTRQFFGEAGIPPVAVTQLARGLRERNLDVAWAVETMVRSQRFFGEDNLGTRVVSPVEFVVGSARALELFDPAPSTLAMADWAGRMGQDVFDPPNVGGWPTGRKWIHSRSLIARANYAYALVTGPNCGRAIPYEAREAARKYGFGNSGHELLTYHHRLFFGTDPSPETLARMATLDPARQVAALLASPEAQLG